MEAPDESFNRHLAHFVDHPSVMICGRALGC